MTKPSDGYRVASAGVRRRARDFADEHAFLQVELRALQEAFFREGRPLGDDQYGRELEKNLPGVKELIFGGLQEYIDEVESVRVRLIENATGYDGAEQANTLPSE